MSKRPSLQAVCYAFSGFLAACLPLAAGCERSAQTPNGAPLVMPVPKSDTPEGKLARVVDRLETALENAQAAPGSGVVSTRTASSRLIASQQEGDPLTAEITIHTIVAVDQATAEQMAKRAEQKIEAKKAQEPVVPPTDEELTEGEVAVEASPEPEDVKPVDPKTLTKPMTKDSVFQLVYGDDRWQLATELTPDQATERICFDYALED